MAKAKIFITLKNGILDPQGVTIAKALTNMGYSGVGNVRIGKLIDIEFDSSVKDPEEALKSMCDRLLANPVIEDYRFEMTEQG